MKQRLCFTGGVLGFIAAGFVLALGCTSRTSEPNSRAGGAAMDHDSPAAASSSSSEVHPDEDHGHEAGAHGGVLVSLGRDSYHVEAIVTDAGDLRLYTLGNDETRVMDIEVQELVAYAKSTLGAASASVNLKPQPQAGDGEGKASLFVGQLPESLIGRPVKVTVPNITISGERFRLGFTTENEAHGDDDMPAKVADDAERELYLTPGGIYTQKDIEANGSTTASQKFVGFHAKHDLKPKVGDKICPVTLTKANPECTWIIGGKSYEFCCPPCVDEFVALSKSNPELVKDPSEYVKSDDGGVQ